MALIKFTLGANTFTFTKGREYPLHDPTAVNVVSDYSEGRKMYAYDKGIREKQHNLHFIGLDATDNANVENWIKNICVGPKNTFTYTDEDGSNHTVRCPDRKNPLEEYGHQIFRGTIRLREEI
jgi:hypothetical protein